MKLGQSLAVAAGLMVMLSLGGCKKAAPPAPDYSRQLPPGEYALRKITDPAQRPDFSLAFGGRDQMLLQSLDRSAAWFEKGSTRQFFPSNGISHEQAWASVLAFRQAIAQATSADDFRRRMDDLFDVYISVGWDDQGTVLFTGYYSPIFDASRVPTNEYRYPLYRRPADLVSDPITGAVLGRRMGQTMGRYPTRAQIEAMGPQSLGLAGQELVYLRDKFDAYLIHVNGSARLRLTDGSWLHIGYAGNNGYSYTSIGRLLVSEGKIDKNRLSLPTIRQYFREHPEDLDTYIKRNDRYVFFQEYPPNNWPSGSLGFPVTPWRSLATDKTIFPRGCVTLVSTHVPVANSPTLARFSGFMMDQDTGGAIRAAGRSDLYMGVGPQAEQLAGRQFAEGHLYYLFLKPEKVQQWLPTDKRSGGVPSQAAPLQPANPPPLLDQ
ncbi:MAG: MltA domain-containing protein [Phycisphaeraceae bacterium]|nr:MltA domain-containing protein [Phycisphaeraceae bacterium]